MNIYRKPALNLEYWCVSRKDLYMVHNFFRERFGDRPVMLAETRTGHNRAYADFEEFEKDIELVLAANDEVTRIGILKQDLGSPARKYVWLDIEFSLGTARFTVSAVDEDGSLKNWADETYKEMERLFALFRPANAFIEILKRDFLKTYPERRRTRDRGLVVLDYDGNIKDRIHRELASPASPDSPAPAMPKGKWWKDRRILAGLIGSLLLLALLIASFWLR